MSMTVPDTAKETPSIVELLDEIGLDFALHTHHPLTHLEDADVEDAAAVRRATGRCASPI